ncbi:lipoyl protein ligase domain-containing protein [Xylanimonas ulmi]|uniref:Lipoate-protein ligase A n=1 Tax=Xylanimonas ulmi TaxID=228973 RepID=A0A4Q7M5P4_9MICO|nr:lipoate--protein ligase family protein [Xylanibacterium ulmi]RZS61972.1 lipoate-protein ligase A [Xylanibacterium ulmi]
MLLLSAHDDAGGAGLDPALDLALAHALVRRAGAGDLSGAVRVSRPAAPVVVFGRRDVRHARFAAAADAARAAGFEPLVRAVGGLPVAYTRAAVVVDHVGTGERPGDGIERRFADFGDLYARALRRLGVAAQVGPVPGEYCPGAHSVNARGQVKLVGTAQRVVRDAWLFSALVVVDDADRVRAVLGDVYRLLDLPFDARSVGALADEAPGTDVEAVRDAVLAVCGERDPLVPAPLDDATLALARTLAAQHRVTVGAVPGPRSPG